MNEHHPLDDAPSSRSTRNILGALRDNAQRLITHELAAAKQELIDGVKQQVSGVVLLLVAALVSLPFILFLGAAAALALTLLLPAWLAWLSVAGVFFVLMLGLLLVGKKRLAVKPSANRTVTETKAAIDALNRAVSRTQTDQP